MSGTICGSKRKDYAHCKLFAEIGLEPVSLLELWEGDPLARISLEHLNDEVLALLRNLEIFGECKLALHNIGRSFGKVLRFPRVCEGIPPNQHDVEMNSSRPDVCSLAVIHVRSMQHLLQHHPHCSLLLADLTAARMWDLRDVSPATKIQGSARVNMKVQRMMAL
jgi:hypothetical protein